MSGAAKFGDPRPYSAEEQASYGKRLRDYAQQLRYQLYKSKNIPFVRAVNWKGDPVCLKTWLSRVWSGELFPSNPYIRREAPKNRRGLRNHRQWLLVSEVLAGEYSYWVTKKDSEETFYPNLDWLVFRHPDDFVCGIWKHFSAFWLPLIADIPSERERDEVWESLLFGVDTLSYSEKIKRRDARRHRKNLYLYSRPVRSKFYVRHLLGRRANKRSRGKGSVVGYVPVQYKRGEEVVDDYLEVKTNKKHQRYYGTIYSKMESWLKEGTVRYVGNRDQLGPEFMKREVRCILPFVVEPEKPRYELWLVYVISLLLACAWMGLL